MQPQPGLLDGMAAAARQALGLGGGEHREPPRPYRCARCGYDGCECGWALYGGHPVASDKQLQDERDMTSEPITPSALHPRRA